MCFERGGMSALGYLQTLGGPRREVRFLLGSRRTWSYVRKLVTELSGGVFGYLDSVLERHSFDEFGELI